MVSSDDTSKSHIGAEWFSRELTVPHSAPKLIAESPRPGFPEGSLEENGSEFLRFVDSGVMVAIDLVRIERQRVITALTSRSRDVHRIGRLATGSKSHDKPGQLPSRGSICNASRS